MTTWMITGCSSGLGWQLAYEVLDRGHNAVVTARDATKIADFIGTNADNVLALPLDVTNDGQITRVVQEAEQHFGAIDVLVNNAGYGYRSAVEEGDQAQVDELFATNFFGTVSTIKAVLPSMRARRRGAIVNVSSIGARTCPPGSGYYAASKAAVEAMSASLRKELASLGITVTIVEPGAFRTNFNGRSLQVSNTVIDDYADTVGQRRKDLHAGHGAQPGDPVRAAAAIISAVESPNPPLMLVLGPDAFDSIGKEYDALRRDLDTWQSTSVGTSFPA